jgi:signal transduction histidine kinase
MICHLFPEPTFFIFTSEVPELLYYSHIPVSILALVVGFFVYFHNRHSILHRLLLFISICFSLWTFANLIAWTNINSGLLLFIWALFGLLTALLSILCIYFIYVFLYERDAPIVMKVSFIALLLPVLLLTPTDLNVSGFNISHCDAFEFEGTALNIYYNTLGGVAMLWIGALLYRRYKTASREFRKQILLMGIGIEFFLFTFFSITFLASYLTLIEIFEDSRLEMYGMFGMFVFMVFIGILMVQFKAFKITLIAPRALTVLLLILVGSQYTYVTTTSGILLTTVTLILTTISSIVLMRSINNEIKSREHIEKLLKKIESNNKRLKQLDKLKSEFVSIASHQLRSPITVIRGYTSMILEGSFGIVPPKVKEAVEHIASSSQFMASSVEDYLNVSRIESGNMKYSCIDFNLAEEASKVVDDLRRTALQKGLVLSYSSDLTKKGIVNADRGKVQQIIQNLITNAIKYTPKGSITVYVHDNPKTKQIYVEVSDTGIGMSKETIDSLFGKFVRANNAYLINVTGTGLGLYIAREMAEKMNGSVTAHSKGEGLGSTFVFTLPLQM